MGEILNGHFFHPGRELSRQYLDPLGLSVELAALALEVPPERLAPVLDGEAPIDAALAVRLEAAFGILATEWLARQARYDVQRERARQRDVLGRIVSLPSPGAPVALPTALPKTAPRAAPSAKGLLGPPIRAYWLSFHTPIGSPVAATRDEILDCWKDFEHALGRADLASSNRLFWIVAPGYCLSPRSDDGGRWAEVQQLSAALFSPVERSGGVLVATEPDPARCAPVVVAAVNLVLPGELVARIAPLRADLRVVRVAQELLRAASGLGDEQLADCTGRTPEAWGNRATLPEGDCAAVEIVLDAGLTLPRSERETALRRHESRLRTALSITLQVLERHVALLSTVQSVG